MPLAVLACNTLSGAGDLTVGACQSCGATDARASDGSASSGDGNIVLVDAGLDADVDWTGYDATVVLRTAS